MTAGFTPEGAPRILEICAGGALGLFTLAFIVWLRHALQGTGIESDIKEKIRKWREHNYEQFMDQNREADWRKYKGDS